ATVRLGRRDRVDRGGRGVLRSGRTAGANHDATHSAARRRCARRPRAADRRSHCRPRPPRARRMKPRYAHMYDNLLANVPTDLYIGGKWRPASDGARFHVIDPATENAITSVANATVADASAAVDAASAAFAEWAARKPRERAEVLRKAYEL